MMDENTLDLALKVYSKVDFLGREPSSAELDILELSSAVIVDYILDKNPELDLNDDEDSAVIDTLFRELEVDYALKALSEKGFIDPIFNEDGSISYEPNELEGLDEFDLEEGGKDCDNMYDTFDEYRDEYDDQ